MSRRSIGYYLKWPLLKLLRPPVVYFSGKISAAPDREVVFARLTDLYNDIVTNPKSKEGKLIHHAYQGKNLIMFTDLHKGNRKRGDEFRTAEKNYLAALAYYNDRGAHYINLGDSEEFWKYNIFSILNHNKATFDMERKFVERNAFSKIYGNHDLFWKLDPLAGLFLMQIYGRNIPIHGGLVIRLALRDQKELDLFCTHGHQGDKRSDGSWFSMWFVAYIWAPLQNFLEVNINTPATNQREKKLHNRIMYAWSEANKNVILVTGHTHQTIFHTYNHLEWLHEQRAAAVQDGDKAAMDKWQAKIDRHPGTYNGNGNTERTSEYKPIYFNAGCGCYSDGSLTGLEIADEYVRLIKWHDPDGKPERTVIEELSLREIYDLHFAQE